MRTKAIVFILGAAALTAGGCRAHSQDLALDQAALEFYAMKPAPCWTINRSGGVQKFNQDHPVYGTSPTPDDARALLSPWIVGPNEYVIEGCKHQARYRCDSTSCVRDGEVEPLKAFVQVTPTLAATRAASEAPPPTTPGADGLTPEAAQAESDDASALRAILEAHRSELASCVDRLPLGLKVAYAPGTAPSVSLRGDLHDKPEEACVRAVLKDMKLAPFKTAGTVIHVVK